MRVATSVNTNDSLFDNPSGMTRSRPVYLAIFGWLGYMGPTFGRSRDRDEDAFTQDGTLEPLLHASIRMENIGL